MLKYPKMVPLQSTPPHALAHLYAPTRLKGTIGDFSPLGVEGCIGGRGTGCFVSQSGVVGWVPTKDDPCSQRGQARELRQ